MDFAATAAELVQQQRGASAQGPAGMATAPGEPTIPSQPVAPAASDPANAAPQGGPGGAAISAAPVDVGAQDIADPGQYRVNPLTGQMARLPDQDKGLNKGFLDAVVGGSSQAVFETKDFLLGQPQETQKSAYRKNVEGGVKEMSSESTFLGLTAGFAQFGTALLGAGKLVSAARLVPKVAAASDALIQGAGVAGKAIQFSGKAAVAGAVAFDPHQERLSNLVQDTWLSNPINGFLASDPKDSNAMGRVKAAMESVGMDAIAVGLFTAVAKGAKLRRLYSEGKATPEEVKAADVDVQDAIHNEQGAQLQPQEGVDPGIIRSANDNDGYSVTAFHGTSKDFEQFDPAAKGSGAGGSDTQHGFFFAKDPDVANSYAGSVYQGSYDGVAHSKIIQDNIDEMMPTMSIIHEQGGKGLTWEQVPLDIRESYLSNKIGEFGWVDRAEGIPETPHGPVSEHGMEYIEKQFAKMHNDLEHAKSTNEAVEGNKPNVRPTKLRMDNPYVHDFEGASYNPTAYNRILEKAKAAGHDSAVLKNVHDGGPSSDIYVVFDKDQIKSRFEDGTTEAAKTQPLEVNQPKGDTLQGANDNTPASGLEVSQVKNPTAAGAPKKPNLPAVSDEQLEAIMQSSMKDIDALGEFGSWSAANDAGHVFNKGGSIPWQKIAEPYNEGATTGLDAFVTRLAEHLEPQLNKMKGGDVLSDARVDKMVDQMGTLWGVDPAAAYGVIQQAGKNAASMVANMEAGFRLGQRALQDTYAMAAKIHAGFLDEWGGDKEAAYAALKDMTAISAQLFGSTLSMRAAAGRTMRRMRGEFKLDPQQVLDLQALDGEQLAKLLAGTGGSPRALSKALNPSMWAQTVDAAQWVMSNGLISGPLTHFVNLTSNFAVAIERPLERALGAALNPRVSGEESQRIRAAAMKSYYYMGASIHESWDAAIKSWSAGDSLLAPHGSELQAAEVGFGAKVAAAEFRPMDTPGNMLYNLSLIVGKSIGMPHRAAGFADEFFKQTIYRSNVLANAHVQGVSEGLDGQALEQFVRGKLFNAFDSEGRGVDLKALQEAKTATFQNDLLPGTLGLGIQQAANTAKEIKVVLPFIKTPSNLIRMGWKLTPGLNLAQKEYRAMLSGAQGPEAAAQAMGQMAMGGLFMGTAGYLANAGMVTGGGPSDPKIKDALQATGWRPYSVVTINKETGARTYVPFNRFDPIGMPFGIAADIADILNTDPDDGESKAQQAAVGLLLGITKNISNKTYLRNLAQAIEGLTDPDKSMAKTAGGVVTGFIPFSAAARFLNDDPHLRDARDFTDRIKTSIPGFSKSLPAKRDAFGDPITVNKGLWVNGKAGIVDAEVERIANNYGFALARPNPGITGGVDLRDVTMKDGVTNAYTRYEELSRQPAPGMKPLKDMVANLMHMKVYRDAQEGDAGTKGTKMYLIAGVAAKYRNAALKQVQADPEVRKAMMKRTMDVVSGYATAKSQAGNPLLNSLGIVPNQ